MVDEKGNEKVDFGKLKRIEKMKHSDDTKYDVIRKKM